MNKKEMHCKQICSEFLQKSKNSVRKGRVHSVYSSSFNILLETDRLLTILNHSRVISPYSIRLKADYNFQKLDLARGQQVDILENYIEVMPIHYRFLLNGADCWDNSPKLDFVKKPLTFCAEAKQKLANYIVKKGSRDGIYPLLQCLIFKFPDLKPLFLTPLPYSETEKFIENRFVDFIETFIAKEKEMISSKSDRIIGFGIGSTPAMDDFISGLMVGSIYASYYFNRSMNETYALNRQVIAVDLNRTTKISAEMLRHSSEGKVNEALRNVLLAIYAEDSQKDFARSVDQVLAMGASSGTDTLLGVYCSLCLNTNFKE